MNKKSSLLKTPSLLIFAVASIFYLTGCGQGSSDASALVVAIKPDKNPDAMESDRADLSARLTQALGRQVDVIIPTSGAVVEQGLANGTIDLAFVSSTSLARYSKDKLADLLLVVEQDGDTTYESLWVSLADKPYSSVQDLKGKAVCFASPTSTSGNIIPTYDLSKQGLVTAEGGRETFFGEGNVQYGTGYVSAIQRVLDGIAEAAAVSDYVMEKDLHLKPEQKARLKIIDRQGPVPTHTLAVRSSLSAEDRSALKDGLLELQESETALPARIFTGDLVVVEADAHLAPIRSALAFVSELSDS
ncbi:MAG: phosphate/phosphite/phosphonate ABC transporter substrate-binding protein [Cyanothece sp. SIO2G6]|nr:phosphate/phosphite/phosphonate ABC transporter substrate-binding protein [Cyanothece sp. SIO2G6]